MIYLDSAATTLQKPKRVAEMSLWALNNLASPGRGQYYAAAKSAKVVYNCREKAAQLFNVGDADNVLITFNATHALNIAINTLAYKGCRAVVSGYEHNAVMRPLRYAGANIVIAKSPLFERQAAIDAFDKSVHPGTDLVVCTAMSNVFGFILPIYEIADICKERNVPLIVDASQGAGVLNLDFKKLGAAFMAMPGHKGLYGPQGTGLLLCSRDIKPLMSGGTGGSSRLLMMPDYLPDAGEAGTHNMPGIAGLSAGIDYVLAMTPDRIIKHEQRLLRLCAGELEKIGRIRMFYSDDTDAQGGVLSFVVKGMDSNLVSEILDKHGICVRAGLHCAPTAHETVGTVDEGTVRISFSAFSTVRDVYIFTRTVEQLCKK